MKTKELRSAILYTYEEWDMTADWQRMLAYLWDKYPRQALIDFATHLRAHCGPDEWYDFCAYAQAIEDTGETAEWLALYVRENFEPFGRIWE
jgi:hypothetical protein